jgi:predicted Zn-dependent protease
MIRRRSLTATAFLSLLTHAAVFAGADASEDVLLRALDAELKRSVEGLQEVEGPPLYYLGYEAHDQISYSLNAELGAIKFETTRRDRSLDVDVRVGTRQLDNTHQLKGRSGRFEFPRTRYTEITVDDDENALRADIWKRTDEAFKDAVNRYTTVETNKAVTATEEDKSDDFSVEKPSTFYETVSFPEIDRSAWRERIRRISEAAKRYPFVFNSQANLSVETRNRYIVNSEGSRIVTGNTFVRLSLSVQSQTEDGMGLYRFRSYDADRPEDLPPVEAILKDVETAAGELEALLSAPLVDPYTGPAIFRHRATGVFFHEILGHRLEGHRQKLEREGQTFTKMVGQEVVADFISVYDDPTQQRFREQFLRGYYRFDDEGVASRRVTLIQDGVLKGFLMSRSPIANFDKSNGHGRRSAGRFVVARMGNTIVEASETVKYERLRQMLIEAIERQDKPYGLIFDDISGGFTSTGRGGTQSFKVIPHLVYRVYTDGRPDEVVRGVDIVGTPLTSFGKIIAAADDYDVFNGSCGAESGWVPVSAVAPSILVSEIEVEKRAKTSDKPPILPTPHHAPKDRDR